MVPSRMDIPDTDTSRFLFRPVVAAQGRGTPVKAAGIARRNTYEKARIRRDNGEAVQGVEEGDAVMEVAPRRLVGALALVFLLGVGFALVNNYYYDREGTVLPILVYAISFISIALGAALVMLLQWRISERQVRTMLKLLPGEERRVVGILLDSGGSLEQNRLVALSGYGKVKISRILKRLEERDVVKKTTLGNTNLVVLDI